MEPQNTPSKVIFLDRDGVINRDSTDYIKTWAEFSFLPRSLDALRDLTRHGFTVILITNQSIINRGMVPRTELDQIHAKLRSAVKAHGGLINDIFFCPHAPDEGCKCRKPEPGLILQAAHKYGIAPADTWMIGDNASDIECARRAGCGGTVWVKSGLCADVEAILARKGLAPDLVVADLFAAVQLVIRNRSTYPLVSPPP